MCSSPNVTPLECQPFQHLQTSSNELTKPTINPSLLDSSRETQKCAGWPAMNTTSRYELLFITSPNEPLDDSTLLK
ncbi:hypothetical protein BLNAU_23929 [Blattamonas nauphoetae]|uniref:Uncharacterized protein n=1 Tax=Blattamonas nauphoetae TaxID=2049346 RepID=A0ABQ9WNU1_9EUKA|nr:hypothetical protein BLNAU_23929 [Blattamonas nauphoetae]